MGVSEKPFLRALRGEVSAVPPVWLMRQAGRYLPEYRALRAQAGDFLRFCLTPELAAEATMQPIRRFGFDAAILFADILIVPHALGQEVGFREGEGPVLGSLGELHLAAVWERAAPVFETVRRVKAALPKEIALIGFAGAPWTVATYMIEGGSSRDFAQVKRRAFTDPAGFSVLVETLIEATTLYLSGQIEAGVEAVQLFDSWSGVLPEPEFRRWVIQPTRQIAETLKARHPGIPLIGFPRGAGVMYEAYVRESGLDAVSVDATLPLGWIRERLQAQLPVQGNLDPILLVTGGAPMERAVREIRAALGDGPFVFNLGHGIVPETPPEHVMQLVELVRR